MISEDGRHESQVELYTTRQPFDRNTYCVEAWFISESTPGADRIVWSGKLYKTERSLNLEGLSPGEIGLIDRITLLGRYEDQPLTDDTPAFRKVSPRSCETCRGGTIQTMYDFVETRLLKVPTIFASGEHLFNVGVAPVALPSEVEWKMPVATSNCSGGFDCFLDLQGTIEEELSEDVDTGILGFLIRLITEIADWFD